MKSQIALVLLLASQRSLACLVTPPPQHTPPDELIARTENIALAKVVREDAASNGWDILYTFETIKQLKGEHRKAFQILGDSAIWEASNHRFNDHFDENFWNDYNGRESHDTSCRIRPGFAVGGTYLIFLDKPYHSKSFEMILVREGPVDKKDKWLQYVEQRTWP
ncbi:MULTISPECIES: hypothetical protein [unclassified Lysobacter]